MSHGDSRRDGVAIGIDVGGTKVAMGLVTAKGELSAVERLTVAESPSFATLLTTIAGRAAQLVSSGGEEDVTCLGVGLPELVDLDGEVVSASIVPWGRKELMATLGGIGRVTIVPDVRAAAVAEARFGAGREWRSFVYISVGTGISYSFVQAGHPWTGVHGTAQLLGSSRLAMHCGHCGFRSSSLALEDAAAGPALLDRAMRVGGLVVSSAEELFARAADGHEAAVTVLADAAEEIGSFVALVVNLLDPEGVVVGGGLGLAGGPYWENLVRSARSYTWAESARSVPIVAAALGTTAGVIGAGLLALDDEGCEVQAW